ncbi:MAG: manganese efflux pump [Sphingobacteriia bacterium]|jgi:manganese efflux pump family protein|nr:manganese efflux pump [Paludibacteraceae bacterium]NCA79426.1 manganese efflux pump [Sphingobacteriia bacterium]
MTILEISLISIGLAMDCFAVSIASSIAYGRYNWAKMLRMAFFFAFFQGAMPFIGWLAGVSFAEQITRIDHWLAFVILAYLGGKMIYGSLKKKQEDVCCDKNTPFGSLKMLIILSFATSIDALATGLIFVPFGNLIYTAVGIIALGSFLFTIVGCVIGIMFGKKFKINVELIGGIILFGIGTKILVEHLIQGC